MLYEQTPHEVLGQKKKKEKKREGGRGGSNVGTLRLSGFRGYASLHHFPANCDQSQDLAMSYSLRKKANVWVRLSVVCWGLVAVVVNK